MQLVSSKKVHTMELPDLRVGLQVSKNWLLNIFVIK